MTWNTSNVITGTLKRTKLTCPDLKSRRKEKKGGGKEERREGRGPSGSWALHQNVD